MFREGEKKKKKKKEIETICNMQSCGSVVASFAQNIKYSRLFTVQLLYIGKAFQRRLDNRYSITLAKQPLRELLQWPFYRET